MESRPIDLTVTKRSDPIVAWRAWGLDYEVVDGDWLPVLASVTWRGPWPTAELAAACTRSGSPGHRAPELDCACGIYAMKWPRFDDDASGPLVAGRVALAGLVLEGRLGYRAERARIIGPLAVRLSCHPQCAGAEAGSLSGAPDRGCPAQTHPGTERVSHDTFVMRLRSRLELRYGVDVDVKGGDDPWTSARS